MFSIHTSTLEMWCARQPGVLLSQPPAWFIFASRVSSWWGKHHAQRAQAQGAEPTPLSAPSGLAEGASRGSCSGFSILPFCTRCSLLCKTQEQGELTPVGSAGHSPGFTPQLSPSPEGASPCREVCLVHVLQPVLHRFCPLRESTAS